MNSDDEPHRIFNPLTVPYYAQIAEHQPFGSVTYNADKGFFQLQGSIVSAPRAPRLDTRSLVVYIGVASAVEPGSAAYALHFGSGSRYNVSDKIQPSLARDNRRAHIEALEQAIKTVSIMLENNFSISTVKFATDSEYLVNVFGVDLELWKEDNGRDDDGKPVPYFDKLCALNAQLDEMEYGDDGGIECQLWLVDVGDNIANARQLAQDAL